MRSNKKSSVLALLILSLSLLLTACGGLTAESAKDRLLTAEDFDFEVKIDSSTSDLEMSDIFEGECSELDVVVASYAKSKVVTESEYEERNDSQNGYSLNEYVLQFPTKEDASSFIANVKKLANNSDCEWSYSNTTRGPNGSATGFGTEDFGNVRDLNTAFNVNADESVVFDIESMIIVSGTFFSNTSSEEGGIALAASGDLVVIVHYEVQSDEINSSSDPVTRKNLEKVVEIAFKKMLG
jgi:hypothetical protein